MINGKTYYQILGVQPDAEDIVIKAAYRALAQRCHPDKWSGDPKVATERMVEINRAYEVLSNTVTRSQYDDEITQTGKSNEYSEDPTAAEAVFEHFKENEESWEYAKQYHPEIESYFQSLRKISTSLAFEFRLIILQQQAFSSSKLIYEKMRSGFLARYFGSNASILFAVELLFQSDRKEVLIELNKANRILGPSIDAQRVLDTIEKKFGISKGVLTGEITRKFNSIAKVSDLITELERIGFFVRLEPHSPWFDKRYEVLYGRNMSQGIFSSDGLIEWASSGRPVAVKLAAGKR